MGYNKLEEDISEFVKNHIQEYRELSEEEIKINSDFYFFPRGTNYFGRIETTFNIVQKEYWDTHGSMGGPTNYVTPSIFNRHLSNFGIDFRGNYPIIANEILVACGFVYLPKATWHYHRK